MIAVQPHLLSSLLVLFLSQCNVVSRVLRLDSSSVGQPCAILSDMGQQGCKAACLVDCDTTFWYSIQRARMVYERSSRSSTRGFTRLSRTLAVYASALKVVEEVPSTCRICIRGVYQAFLGALKMNSELLQSLAPDRHVAFAWTID